MGDGGYCLMDLMTARRHGRACAHTAHVCLEVCVVTGQHSISGRERKKNNFVQVLTCDGEQS